MVVVDDEVDEIDYNEDLDTCVQALLMKNQRTVCIRRSDKDILEGHIGGRFINPCPPIGVGNGKPDGWEPLGVAPGRVDGCSNNCGRLIS